MKTIILDTMGNKKTIHYFIDECGDPNFYGKGKKLLVGTEGYQPLLIIGMIKLENRKAIKQKVVEFQNTILADPFFNTIPSVADPKGWFLHARSDHPEVRIKFFELIRSMKGIEAHIVVGRKELEIFNRKHNNNPGEFYYDLLQHLLKENLVDRGLSYHMFLAQRGKDNLSRFTNAVEGVLQKQEEIGHEIQYKCNLVLSSQCPEMSIIDYMLWALQRYILKGEKRFFTAIESKYPWIYDVYDNRDGSGKGVAYGLETPFNLEKASFF